MSLVLVIGGYGGFGARLCRRLAAAGHDLLVGGRDLAKATRMAETMIGARPIALDRNADIGPVLALHRPDLVIDAAGPFQDSDYAVPRACIAARVPYFDLADARAFVVGISALDREARAAGVPVVSGASSVPALTDAVAQRLARGLTHVTAVDVALSAANRASGGASVMSAILSYVGRPLRLWRGGCWVRVYGWGELRRIDFDLAQGRGLHGRLVAITDVPDHDLLSPRLPGRPAVTFRAGTELGIQMLGLAALGWAVQRGWLPPLRRFERWLMRAYRVTERIGGARSAMRVTLVGEDARGPVERRWTIVAEDGRGVDIPTIAAALLADDLAARRLAPGAHPAVGLLDFGRFADAWAGLPLTHEVSERRLPPPLYARVLGRAFDGLPPALRAMHKVHTDAGAYGAAQVSRGRTWPARLIAGVIGFPPQGEHPLHVHFTERNGEETWTRDFGGHVFSSRLSAAGGGVQERFGPLRFVFDLPCGPAGLEMHLRRWSVFKLPLPLALAPRIAASEWEEGGRFRFDVRVALPLAGELVRYTGWLEPCAYDKGGSGEPEPPRMAELETA